MTMTRHVIICLLLLVAVINADTDADTSGDVSVDDDDSGDSSAAAGGSFTFLTPGTSYLEYHANWPEVHDLQLEFTFRTYTTNTMLLQHSFLEVEGAYRPELKVLLSQGVLQVEHRYGDVVERLAVAKGMSHDRWHKVKVVVSLGNKEIRGQVGDRPEKTKGLKALVDPNSIQAYQNGPRTSIVFIGGFSPESLQQPSAFIGCVKDVRFSDGTNDISANIHSQGALEEGCLSACGTDNTCQNNGKCVNLYTNTQCDCFQTGYHGDTCDKQGLTTVTLTGDEWIRYNLYEDVDVERSHMAGIRVALDFRTSVSEGVLFYASETQPQYNHLAVSLFNGTLHVSVVFEDRETHSELYTTIGDDLSDGRWHSLIVMHEGKVVRLNLDNDSGEMEAKNSHPHLNMPEMIYYAGIEEGYPGIGLRSQKTFSGCMRSMYFNHIAVLDHLDDRAFYHGNSPLEYKCQDVYTTSLQYQHDGSYIRIQSGDQKELDVEFEIRTYKSDTLLFHVDMGTYDYKGYIKGYLVGAKFELHIVPSSYHGDERQILTLGYDLNNAEWHTIKVYFRSGMVQLWVDQRFMVQPVKWNLIVGKATYFGYAPDMFDEKKSYIGCMRHLVVQGVHIDPLPLVKSENSVGVSVGSCDLTDWCANENPCINKGKCVSEWFTSYCDCSPTYHEGSNCQFSLLRRSCEEYFLSGNRTSGVHRVDLDGNGPIKPLHVYCQLGAIVDGRKYGMTQVEHNLRPQTKFRGNLKDMRKEIAYRDMGKSVLTSLVENSAYCRQHLSLNCFRAFLGLGKQTWFVSAEDHTYSHVGSGSDGSCVCDVDNTCNDDRHKCNCDQNSGRWVTDEAYIDSKQEVPITEMTFLQLYGGQANVTLGPLECVGKSTHTEEHVVMFTTSNSHFDIEGWTGGNIEFIFRTLKAPAILLYQHGQDSSHSDTQLSIELVSDHMISLRLKEPLVEVDLVTTQTLTSGDWQYLQIEIGRNQLRASIAGVKKIIDLPDGVEGPGKYSTRLYVGDKPMKQPEDAPGIVGCIGGITYNGKSHKLEHLVGTKVGLYHGCPTQCESDPCQNNAECIEQWDSYHCVCSNKYAHSGDTCQHNMNENSVKLVREGVNLHFLEPDLDVLGSEYYFSFRTTQKGALLLYVHDHYNNFIQMDVEDGETFHLSYNNGYKIEHATVKVTGLTDGRWKQVAIYSSQGMLRLDVEGIVKDYKDERMPLMTYSQVPFKVPESVVPVRNLHAPPAGAHLFIGGVPQDYVGPTGLKGCVRGLMIGELLVDLATAGEDKEGFVPGCPTGCEADPCKNGGQCLDDVDFNEAYTCDCSGTGFAQENCDGEVGVYLKGDATMEQSLRSLETGGDQARLELAFATSEPSIQKTAVGFVRGKTGLSDYMLLYLTTVKGRTCVAADVQVQDQTVSVVGDKNTADGRPHKVVLERQGSKVTLEVDGSSDEGMLDNEVTRSHDPVALLDVGWVRKDNFRFTEYTNFTGDIWNVFLTSDSLGVVNARPLEVYNDYDDGNHGIVTVGIIAPVTQSLDGLLYSYMYGDSVWGQDEVDGSYPPWNPGAAKTVQLNSEDPDADQAGASPAIAFIVCGLALVFFLGLTLFLVLRHRHRSRGGTFTIAVSDRADEEEGLLKKVNPHIEGLEEEDEPIATAKLRQGPKKTRSGSGEEEDENEETPMLQSEVPMAETGPGESIPMETFNTQIREMSPVEEITGIDMELVPPVLSESTDKQLQVLEGGSVGPPKPPRISIIEASDETISEDKHSDPEVNESEIPVTISDQVQAMDNKSDTSTETGEPATPIETSSPETETSPPETETSPPETETSPPETETSPPETETSPPETETSPPETETSPPATETSPPQTETSPPETAELDNTDVTSDNSNQAESGEDQPRTVETSQSAMDPPQPVVGDDPITKDTAQSSVTIDDESGEEEPEDIQIKAEVYKEPQPGNANQSETSSNSSDSSPVAVNGGDFNDEITEIGTTHTSDKTASLKQRDKKKLLK